MYLRIERDTGRTPAFLWILFSVRKFQKIVKTTPQEVQRSIIVSSPKRQVKMTTQRRIAKRCLKKGVNPQEAEENFDRVQMSGKKVTCATVESSPGGKRFEWTDFQSSSSKVEDESKCPKKQ